MSSTLSTLFHTVTDGGVAAQHPPQQIHSVLVGPSTTAERNTIQEDLTPIACVQLKDARFEFDSSFVSPKVATEMKLLGRLHTENSDAPLSIFGHADPVGDDDYNKQLSGRRAQAIYGLLTRDTALWEDLHTNTIGGDDWDLRTTQTMLETVGHSPGPIDGIEGEQTTDAIKEFQTEQGLTVDGNAGPQTREKLFLSYMDAVCVDENDEPFRLDPAGDFLAGGEDADGKGDYQGCSEFNPVLLFSQAENEAFKAASDKSERNKENEPNRRVLMFLFRPGTRVIPERWPCPCVKEGVADCKKRFFSDGELRRSFQPERRLYENTKDTFACRFYDRIAIKSPCERSVLPVFMTLDVVLDIGPNDRSLPDRFQLVSGDGLYNRTLDRSQAIPFDQNRLNIRFTEVLAGQTYSLFQEWTTEGKVAVFSNVPISSIDLFGPATPQPAPRTAEEIPPPPPPASLSGNALVMDDPSDHSQGALAMAPDPHLEESGLA